MGDLTTKDLGDQLYEARQVMDDDAFDAHLVRLKAASAQVEAGALFAESGNNLSATSGGAWADVQTAAKKLVDAGTAPTIEQAVAKVLDADTKLYDRYTAEQLEA